jgi:SAM-dependent methyltransferase
MTQHAINQIVETPVTVVSGPPRCAGCGSTDLVDVFESTRQPINVGIVYDTVEQARRAPVADITLACCRTCGFVSNRIFDLSRVTFEPGYEVALKHSAIFREFTSSVVDRLIERFDLHGKRICEIGCGAGYFLRLITERGENHGIGIDPTVPSVGHQQANCGSVEFIRDHYGEQHVGIESDFVCCLSVFEDIPRPVEFLTTVRRMIGDRTDVPLYFEVFNAFQAIQNRETWSIHYEQCNYFSRATLTDLFRRCGFEVTDAGTCYQGGQYLYVEAVPAKVSSHGTDVLSESVGVPTEIAEFASRHRQRLEYWNQQFREFQREQQRVVLWGTGGKGISFLNTLNTRGVIEYAVESNPDKQGQFIAGSAQRIVSPEFLTQYQPDTIIVTNALYLEEMRQQASALGVTAEFLVA